MQEQLLLEQRILDLLRQRPGLMAKEIAQALGADRKEVNHALYGPLQDRVEQSPLYHWRLKVFSAQVSSTAQQTDLSPHRRLAAYYLECLAHDLELEVSVFSSSRYGDLDYAELFQNPLITGDYAFGPDAARLLARVKRASDKRAFLGYPVHIRESQGKSGPFYKVEPLFLFPLEDSGALAEESPHLNFAALKSLTGASASMVLEEALQLHEELGLTAGLNALPDWGDLAELLMHKRKDWPWVERLVPDLLNSSPPIQGLSAGGLYNRAVIVLGSKSPYTVGLEVELAQLQKESQERVGNSILGSWISGKALQPTSDSNDPLIEVLPLNVEQRDAVHRSLTQPFTVVTGPPGTGKSQVVSSILINAAFLGQKVLFVSKNNKAVDVVEQRVNTLGPRPILLRLGTRYQDGLAAYLTKVLSSLPPATTTPNHLSLDQAKQRLAEIDKSAERVLAYRNNVDQTEQRAEQARQALGEEAFRLSTGVDVDACQTRLDEFAGLLSSCTKSDQPFLVRLLWQWHREKRLKVWGEAAVALKNCLSSSGCDLKWPEAIEPQIGEWRSFVPQLRQRLSETRLAKDYLQALAELDKQATIEELAERRLQALEELASVSQAVWEAWLRAVPDRMTGDEYRKLADYLATLKMVLASGANATPSLQRAFNDLFPSITRVLPCWAVTSLSARGRLPFNPGFFDLVVIDEASQCDIASVLPIIFRAKRVVVIGDPQQLRHITQLSPRQDQRLLDQHGLLKQFPSWSYSTQSLFDLSIALPGGRENLVHLLDHHRSHADIIGFSNEAFYDSRLRVATRHDRLRPPKDGAGLRWIDVRGQVVRPAQGGAINKPEALAVVSELRRLLVQERYTGTVGVVTPFRAQATLVNDLIHQDDQIMQRWDPADGIADTAHGFQGDERDVVLFSPVVGNGIGDGPIRFLQRTGNLFNVAITRARAALIVVGDKTAAIDCQVEHLSQFALYVDGKRGRRKSGAGVPAMPPVQGSPWETRLLRSLQERGIECRAQHEVPPYLIDIAVIKAKGRLAIEVDGEHYHRAWNGELLRRDFIRTQRLIEQGWDVKRFWVYQVRDDLENCVDRVWAWWSTH